MAVLLPALSLTVTAYLAGSLSTAYLLTRVLRAAAIRSLGSGNAGAVNVFREVGWRSGLAVLAIDAAKGAAVILATSALELDGFAMFGGALGVVIGHNFPAFLGFKGGKGVAPIFGLSLAVMPVLTLVSAALSLAAGLATRNVVFGITVGLVAINALTIWTGQDIALVSLCLVLSAVVIATHFALSFRPVLASVRTRGPWGLFEVE